MTDIVQGTTEVLLVQFYEYAGGPAADITDSTITITNAAGTVVIIGDDTDITRITTGLYSYPWVVVADQAPGTYVALWDGVDADDEGVQASEILTVLADDSSDGTTWVSTAEVEDITGETDVTSAQVRQAQAVIDMYSGLTIDAMAATTSRDQLFLKRAVAYQTVWQRSRPGYLTHLSEITGVQQEQLNFTYTSKAAVMLAPLALRALRNLTWLGTRTVKLSPSPDTYPSFLLESSDDYGVWQPLGGGECA